MSVKKVLVAYDGSAPSHKALDIAKEVAITNPDAYVLLVYVVRLMSSGAAAAGIDTIVMEDIVPIKAELTEIAEGLANSAEVRILKGTSPADLILKCAEQEDCDLIIMGSRGRGGVKGYLGSVSYAVVKDSPITVIIAKEGKEK